MYVPRNRKYTVNNKLEYTRKAVSLLAYYGISLEDYIALPKSQKLSFQKRIRNQEGFNPFTELAKTIGVSASQTTRLLTSYYQLYDKTMQCDLVSKPGKRTTSSINIPRVNHIRNIKTNVIFCQGVIEEDEYGTEEWGPTIEGPQCATCTKKAGLLQNRGITVKVAAQ